MTPAAAKRPPRPQTARPGLRKRGSARTAARPPTASGHPVAAIADPQRAAVAAEVLAVLAAFGLED